MTPEQEARLKAYEKLADALLKELKKPAFYLPPHIEALLLKAEALP